MGRLIGRLTELQVRRLPAGWHNDGGGLYLRVQDRERRWWVFRYGPQGRRYRGLGPTHTLSLAAAREQARLCRQLLLEGADPIAAGKARRTARPSPSDDTPSTPVVSKSIPAIRVIPTTCPVTGSVFEPIPMKKGTPR